MGRLSWYPYAKLSQLDRISCETFRRPSLGSISHPGRRACRARHTERRHARPPPLPPTPTSRSRRSALAGSSTTKASRKARRASASRDGATSTSRPSRITQRAGNTNTLAAPSPSLWTCSKQAKSTSCPTSRIRQNASRSCSFPRTPRAPSATTSTPGPTATICQG